MRGEVATWLRGEQLLVVKLILYPSHQEVNVSRRSHCHWLLDGDPVGPHVLVLWACTHNRTLLLCAELSNDTVKQIDLIEEIDRVHREPFMLVLAFWKRHGLVQISSAKGRLRVLMQFISLGTNTMVPLWPERFRLVESREALEHVHKPATRAGMCTVEILHSFAEGGPRASSQWLVIGVS